jgi:5-methylcytosine-specific restriction enzyme subunit McrC
MKHLQVLEHGKLEVSSEPDAQQLSPLEYQRLSRADHWHKESEAIFSWRPKAIIARQWVGVIQVPGLSIEILPKIDQGNEQDARQNARQNLLYMLAVAGDIPLRERDLAELSVQNMPLSQTLLSLFAARLEEALSLGLDQSYQSEDLVLPVLKGKLLPHKQLVQLAGRLDRFAVRQQRFCEDTPLNRIFKTACRVALPQAASRAVPSFQHCLALLEEAADVSIEQLELKTLTLTRQNQRFQPLLTFARLLLSRHSPTTRHGGVQSFSLLFDMNVVFERFISAFLRKHVLPDHSELQLFTQGSKQTKHLVYQQEKGVLALKPDILIEKADTPVLLIDTKWKRLDSRPSREDLYQLFAYVHRFKCSRSILLYPHYGHTSDSDFTIEERGGRIAVRFANLSRDLRKGRQLLKAELKDVLKKELENI